ncbi:hypothetical protein, partial [Lactiplantibacillus mudanjiangensis]|uniref:hypothetical protein n=1 Tax=Lactiplantibacillus mudanjiangensis TaxID=1296538 RepID=UPI001CDB4970
MQLICGSKFYWIKGSDGDQTTFDLSAIGGQGGVLIFNAETKVIRGQIYMDNLEITDWVIGSVWHDGSFHFNGSPLWSINTEIQNQSSRMAMLNCFVDAYISVSTANGKTTLTLPDQVQLDTGNLMIWLKGGASFDLTSIAGGGLIYWNATKNVIHGLVLASDATGS